MKLFCLLLFSLLATAQKTKTTSIIDHLSVLRAFLFPSLSLPIICPFFILL